MTFPIYFDSKKSSFLFGLKEQFDFLKNLFLKNKLPNILMISGKKGVGKSTLINHLMFFVFDRENYDEKNNEFKSNSQFYQQFVNNIFSNIIYLSGSEFKNIKIDDIRNLKNKILQSSMSKNPRFIILDDIELFNANSLNALLKIIEEPTKKNFFILINNKSRPLMDTIKSRCIDIKLILSEEKRLNIIDSLVKKFSIKAIINSKSSQLTPGYFMIFNYIFVLNKISTEDNFLKNLTILLNLYKKDKDVMYIDMILFLTDLYLNELKKKNLYTNEKIYEYKIFISENINKFFLYNLNQNALLNAINNKINNE